MSEAPARYSGGGGLRCWLARLCAAAWAPAGREARAYFTYAKSKTVLIDGARSYPIVDAVVAEDGTAHRYYQFGTHDGRAYLQSTPLPYRIGIGDVVAALLTLDAECAVHFRFIQLINSGLDRHWIPWRSRWAWDVRTLLVAHAFAWRLREVARVHREAFVTDFYSAAMLGVTLAFRREGREVWDIQHGRIGPSHQAYNSDVFGVDCALRPTGLVVWDKRVGVYVDRALLLRWKSTEFAHLRLARASSVSRPRSVLYTLQVDTQVPREILDLVLEDPSIHWTFRPHPGGRNPEADYLPLLALPNVVLADVRTPLQDDILRCATHVTWNSSVVIEAAALGVCSFVMEARAAADFGDEISTGFATVVPASEVGARLRESFARVVGK